ncbi:MAG TPA: hypothetical protein PKA56_05160 [Solirubrobacterales bacterium]|jgi:hypothetical protein|nr:hypothetical protein [Solirubrobacterales bacterium]HMU26903.1 hypothetical protein [Solirubrobacterales bacterium]HMX71124.1 hypothetical protein [Solirubrobacterales bacterium]HMY24833.1 hypothetical protein [Solirubrobacterales bacterium]HNA23586.1 hypothetical protein [Solirubrobacterales bacterium]
MDADREKAGSGGIGSRRGSVSLELIGSLPIILLAVLVAAQIAIAGAALWSAGVAARAGARAVLTGNSPRGAAEHALPSVLQGGLKVSQEDGVKVGVRVPGLLPGFPETHVYGSSSLGDG